MYNAQVELFYRLFFFLECDKHSKFYAKPQGHGLFSLLLLFLMCVCVCVYALRVFSIALDVSKAAKKIIIIIERKAIDRKSVV